MSNPQDQHPKPLPSPPPPEESTDGPFHGSRLPTVQLGNLGTDDIQLGALTLSSERYGDTGPLGSGGMAVIREGLDPNLGRRVAIKALHPHLRAQSASSSRFIREARIMAQLEHPNIVPVHELGVDAQGGLYFTMKRVQGVTLRHILGRIKKGRPSTLEDYPLGRLLRIFLDICQAVAFAHSRGIVHRDLKPENILVGSFGEVLVMDWGLARPVHDASLDGTKDDPIAPWLDGMDALQSMDGYIAGSPHFMSPEQARGAANEIDQRTDVYSLGVMLYEILTHRYPANGATSREVVRSVIHDPIVPPSKRGGPSPIPRELNAVCMKALAKNRADRYPTVDELRRDLQRFREGRPVSVYNDSLPRRAWKTCVRHPVLSAAVLAAVAATSASIASILVVRAERLQGFIEMADDHRRQGNALYGEKVQLVRDLLAQYASLDVDADDPEAAALSTQIQDLHDRTENHYVLATQLYGTVNRLQNAPDPRTLDGLREILGHRIEYACAIGDFREAEQQLDLIRLTVTTAYGTIPPGIQHELGRYEGMVESARRGERPH